VQFELPASPAMAKVDPALIAKQPSMSRALLLCQTLSGKDDAQFYGARGIVKDQAQWSRIMGPSNHCFPHDKLNLFMDIAGNEAPLLMDATFTRCASWKPRPSGACVSRKRPSKPKSKRCACSPTRSTGGPHDGHADPLNR
jgi:hypothetical protein